MLVLLHPHLRKENHFSDIEITSQMSFVRGVAQLASALAWGARGRKFESSHPDHITSKVVIFFSKRDESHAFFVNDLCM